MVIGAGVIGLELGSVWRRLGAEVTVIEFLDRALPTQDGEISKQAQRILEMQGLKFMLGTKVTSAKPGKSDVTLTVEPAKGGPAQEIKADVVLVAIGRRPFTDGLGLKEIGVELDKRGFVIVDKHYRTNVPGIWAIGDVVGGAMAGAQGGRGRHRGRRADRRPGGACELRRHSRRGLYLARGRQPGQDRGAVEGRRRRLQGRQVPVLGQWPRARQWRDRRLRQDPGRRQDRPRHRLPHHRPGGGRSDGRDGDRRRVRRPPPRISRGPATPIRRCPKR